MDLDPVVTRRPALPATSSWIVPPKKRQPTEPGAPTQILPTGGKPRSRVAFADREHPSAAEQQAVSVQRQLQAQDGVADMIDAPVYVEAQSTEARREARLREQAVNDAPAVLRAVAATPGITRPRVAIDAHMSESRVRAALAVLGDQVQHSASTHGKFVYITLTVRGDPAPMPAPDDRQTEAIEVQGQMKQAAATDRRVRRLPSEARAALIHEATAEAFAPSKEGLSSEPSAILHRCRVRADRLKSSHRTPAVA